MGIENLIFEGAEALRVPVLVAALVAVALVLVELGALVVELAKRRYRSLNRLEHTVESASAALAAGDRPTALMYLHTVAWNDSMRGALSAVVEEAGRPDADDQIAKRLADYDYRTLRRLERTRILVRVGPALGLMGTLIPLSPALAGLAEGNVTELTDNLRVAFSVTVLGLMVGAIAFGISMVRDRIYAQDYSDVEYVTTGVRRRSQP